MEKGDGNKPCPVIRIAVTGPESTGKSAMCRELQKQLGGIVLPEYARKYLSVNGLEYTEKEVEHMARMQADSLGRLAQLPFPYLFADTELINYAIWLEHRYGRCPDWIESIIREQPFDLYLLMDVDLPWEEDPMRENRDDRNFLFQRFVERLRSVEAPFFVIGGKGVERTEQALNAIRRFEQSA